MRCGVCVLEEGVEPGGLKMFVARPPYLSKWTFRVRPLNSYLFIHRGGVVMKESG